MNDAYRQRDVMEMRIARVVTWVVVGSIAVGVWLCGHMWF